MRVSNEDCSCQRANETPVAAVYCHAAAERTLQVRRSRINLVRRRYVLRETSNQALSYNNHVIAEWRRWFDWKPRAQDGRQLRCKRQRNQQEDCCTFHVLQCYPNQARHGKLIIIHFTISCVPWDKPPQHGDEETTIIVSSGGAARMTTRRWKQME